MVDEIIKNLLGYSHEICVEFQSDSPDRSPTKSFIYAKLYIIFRINFYLIDRI